ncbi:uncharacterized protein ColSpa_05903 [Colletotrichum spaethianum]|uniref:Uncharacterized protein n=1 Tax=Colletotrichum spaethianum TaxID=700344 RepID=A0AA37LC17_9PEZI|nr:uncharacterized protein ColSpa_05903 [Colletotrichum spaethianum]GKT45722.1 hypothetical protein ColSpa_05903 [Colletotrichum spaethianum]
MPDSNRSTSIRGRGAVRGSIAGNVRILFAKKEFKPTGMIIREASMTAAGVNIVQNAADTQEGAVASESAALTVRERLRNRVNTGTEGLQHKASLARAKSASPGALAVSHLAAPGTPMSTFPMVAAERAWVAAASRVIAATAEKVDVEREVRPEGSKNGVEVRVAHLEQDRVRVDRGRPTIDASRAKTEAESGGAKTLSVFRTIARRGRDVKGLKREAQAGAD